MHYKLGRVFRWMLVAVGVMCAAHLGVAQGSESTELTIAELAQKANAGDAATQYTLAWHYRTGDGVERDFATAAKWNRLAAEQGYGLAQVALGNQYEYQEGNGPKQDYALAMMWYRKAAEQGIASGMYHVGYMYDAGLGVNKKPAIALDWYIKAAKLGNKDAQYTLGFKYENGVDVPENLIEAERLYRMAAENGEPNAQLCLSRFYESGIVVPVSYSESYFWIIVGLSRIPDEVARKDAQGIKDDVSKHLSSTEILKQQERATKWFAEHK